MGIPPRGRRGLPGNLVEEYRAGIMTTASPFTGFQIIPADRPMSIRFSLLDNLFLEILGLFRMDQAGLPI
jgi:hypothetical protein